MANQKLLEVFLDTKQILCGNDYYIHIPKRTIRVTNSENVIPHLIGMQYIGRPDMFTYKKNEDYDLHYRNLTHCYEISKIVRENKISKRTEMIYQSRTAEEREKIGIEKMLSVASIELDEKLIKSIQCINKKFGRFHTMDQLCDLEKLVMQCDGKREEAVVKAFCKEWERVSEYSKEVE